MRWTKGEGGSLVASACDGACWLLDCVQRGQKTVFRAWRRYDDGSTELVVEDESLRMVKDIAGRIDLRMRRSPNADMQDMDMKSVYRRL